MLSSASKYALQIVIYMARQQGKGKIGGKQIAEDLNLAAPFVGKVVQPLAHRGILNSTKGPNGGFVLARKPQELSLLEIIEIFEGEEAFRECILHPCSCKSQEESGTVCKVHEEIAPAREVLRESLQSKTVADFLGEQISQEESSIESLVNL